MCQDVIRKDCCGLGILHDRADLALDEIGGCRPGIFGTLAVDGQPTAVNEKLHDKYLALLSVHAPAIGSLVVLRGGHATVELNVALQSEPVGDEVQVSQNPSLAGIALGPFPTRASPHGKACTSIRGFPNRIARRDSDSEYQVPPTPPPASSIFTGRPSTFDLSAYLKMVVALLPNSQP